MTFSPWQLEASQALFRAGDFAAQIDVAHPARGLHALELAGRPLSETLVLGLVLPWSVAADAIGADEVYIRGGDLVAVYRWAPLALQVDVCWRAVTLPEVASVAAAWELLVSVRSERLLCEPELAVQSELPCSEVVRFSAEPGCLLGRLSAAELSYLEMVHPTSLVLSERDAVAPGAKIRHRLFAQPLEKGVILRACLRGAMVPRADDIRLATAAYRAFAASEPWLGA